MDRLTDLPGEEPRTAPPEPCSPSGMPAPVAPEPPPAGPPAQAGPARKASSLFEVSIVVLIALFLALLLKVYVAEAYEIRGRSMQPTFEEDERVMILKVWYEIHRGDIIIFSSSRDPRKDLIKRVIGLPGDRIDVRRGSVYVNGAKIDEPYAQPMGPGEREMSEVVRPGMYFVLGDNRPDSEDSRKFHAIEGRSIKGKVILRWWPLARFDAF